MVPEARSRRYTQYVVLSLLAAVPAGVARALMEPPRTPRTAALAGVLLLPLSLLLVVSGVDHLVNHEEWGTFYAEVDWNRRFGSPPPIPMSPRAQPLLYAAVGGGGGLVFLGIAAYLLVTAAA